MNWVNLRTEQMRSPVVAQASHEALATWLRVLTYACEQENSGKLIGAANWNDRAWMVACGVTALEVAGASPLLYREGEDILVSMYPMDKQKEVQKDRLNGKKGGSSRSQAKTEASRRNGSQAKSKHGLASLPNGKEGEGGGNGKENPNPNGIEAGDTPISAEGIIASLRDNPAYAGINLDRELGKMKAWLQSPAGKNRKLTHRFILNWLNRSEREFPSNGSAGLDKSKTCRLRPGEGIPVLNLETGETEYMEPHQ